MDDLVVYIEGIGWWSPGVPGWPAAAALLRGDGAWPLATDASRPAATVLPPGERRRAPEPVLLACEVAAQACAMAGRDAAGVACVFTSMHGDIATTDALCTTLAGNPLEVSPTKFHNSVHNAPVGYWSVATGCHAASNAVSAWRGSLAAGLFEAAVEAHADAAPVLLAAYDIAARGPLADTLHSPDPVGAALLLNATCGPSACAALRLRHAVRADSASLPDSPLAMARSLFAALARGGPATAILPAGAASVLEIEVLA